METCVAIVVAPTKLRYHFNMTDFWECRIEFGGRDNDRATVRVQAASHKEAVRKIKQRANRDDGSLLSFKLKQYGLKRIVSVRHRELPGTVHMDI